MSIEMKVGELARRTGLSVRALHHYDEIGLLSPSRRTAAGHRLYGQSEVERLQQIASLRRLGLPLEDIRATLARPESTLASVLELHLRRIEEEMERQRTLHHLIGRLRDRLSGDDRVSIDDLARTIEVTMNYDKYYSPEQLRRLEQRRQAIGQDRIDAVQKEWQELFAAYSEAMKAGLDPGCEEVQALARKSAALIGEFTGGDPGITASLGAMYQGEGADNVMRASGMEMAPGVWDYMGRATAGLKESQE